MWPGNGENDGDDPADSSTDTRPTSKEPIRVQTDQVTVQKHFDPQHDGIVYVVFVIDVHGDDPIGVQIVEEIPDEIPGDKVGFTPEYDSDHWSIEGRSLVYEACVPAEGEHTTLYGAESSVVDALHEEPSIERVPDEMLPEATAERSPTAPRTTGDDVDGPFTWGDDGDTVEDSETATTSEAHGPTSGGDVVTDSPDTTGSPEEVLSALVTALEDTDLSEDEQAAFREALDVDAGKTEDTLEARLRHVQNTVDDLEAYRDALDELIADRGTGETIVDDLKDEIGSVEASVSELSESLSNTETRLEEEMAGADELGAVSERTDSLEDDLEVLSDRIDRIQDSIEETDRNLAAVNEEITTGQEWRRRVSKAAAVPVDDPGATDGMAEEGGERTATDGGNSDGNPSPVQDSTVSEGER